MTGLELAVLSFIAVQLVGIHYTLVKGMVKKKAKSKNKEKRSK